ncbi:PQQ-dependent sugar dehydrogenase [Paenibacillus sp. MBLB4367]|uniref:PQQ-dependent sugar dehydrogenase n=1 Tax=Paenibacillus sp. MBLB4367 TaxID=3384767 RepID=UPI003907ED0A
MRVSGKRLRSLVGVLAIALAAGGCSLVDNMKGRNGGDGKAGGETAASAAPETAGQAVLPYRQEVVADNLNVPWAFEISSDGRMFFTERSGAVRMIRDGKLVKDPVISMPAPFVSKGEGGLLGLALDPQFADNHYMYVYHTYEDKGQTKNRLLRLIEQSGKAKLDKVLIDGLPGSTNHNGGRIKFGPDGHLYVTSGDRYEPPLAQDTKSLGGKILRIRPDGSVPADNPFPGSPVYSYGHRNPQGLVWQPETGKLFASEHGQSAHDEINVIEAGANYGWPTIEGDQTAPRMKPPLAHSGTTTWAPSGMTFVTKGPWKGSMLAANLRGEQLIRFELSGDGGQPAVSGKQYWLQRQLGRIRDVYEGPDGSLYVLTNNRDGRGTPKAGDDKIIRLVPEAVK